MSKNLVNKQLINGIKLTKNNKKYYICRHHQFIYNSVNLFQWQVTNVFRGKLTVFVNTIFFVLFIGQFNIIYCLPQKQIKLWNKLQPLDGISTSFDATGGLITRYNFVNGVKSKNFWKLSLSLRSLCDLHTKKKFKPGV